MLKRHKDLLRAVVGELRRTLAGTPETRGDLDRELERIGGAPDGTITPLDALRAPTPAERRAHHVAQVQLASLAAKDRPAARAELVERAAYSWINRLLALRAMEARGLIEETLRANPDYEGVSEALYVLRATGPATTTGPDKGWWAVVDAACAAQQSNLPGLFDPTDPAVALRPSTPALLRAVALVGGAPSGFTLAEADAAWADPDAIGWAYQFYQEEAKARVYAKLGSGGKITTRAEIAAATQLFTEPYMVQWLLQNSLGRSYHEAYPASTLPASWPYYIQPGAGDQGSGVRDQGSAENPDTQYAIRNTQSSNPHPPSPIPQRQPLAGLTVLDPCMGSGHFLREAFDMLMAMYAEQYPAWTATQRADAILQNHLFGVDIDPRAAQLAALTLYLRALEGIQADQPRQSAIPHPQSAIPMNLATSPRGLTPGALDRHLARHPEDAPLRPLLEGIFAALEQADLLGSLLRPGEHLDRALAAFRRPQQRAMAFDGGDDAGLWAAVQDLAQRDPAELRRLLFERVEKSFHLEAGDADVSAALFGREAEQGVRLLRLLDRRYAVVVTNPPYMGSGNMTPQLRQYVEQHYLSGKRDLYAAFILRCLDLCQSKGRVAMVTQQSWMFLSSFADLRAVPDERLTDVRKKRGFLGLLREAQIECLADLGPNAFEEISGEVVQSVMFVLDNQAPTQQHQMTALRLVSLKSPIAKARQLASKESKIVLNQFLLLAVPSAAVVYYLPEGLQKILVSFQRLRKFMEIVEGPCTGNDSRFLRFFWEASRLDDWKEFPKGGGYGKWYGNRFYMIRWGTNGDMLKAHAGSIIPNEHFYFLDGLQYTEAASGSLGVRVHPKNAIPGNKAPFITVFSNSHSAYMGVLNCRIVSYFARTLGTTVHFSVGPLRSVPIPMLDKRQIERLETIVSCAVAYKTLLTSRKLDEMGFIAVGSDLHLWIEAHLTSAEAIIEALVFEAYQLSENDTQSVLRDTGTPAGWFPLIAGYDALPALPADLDLPPLPPEVRDSLAAHARLRPDAPDLARITANLRLLYEAGPGAKDAAQEEAAAVEGDEEEAASGAHSPIPTETFLEALSVRLGVHPISVYWLLEEGRAAGWRCRPEEQRLLEDRLSVLVLRLLGHRWPRQIAAGEPVPSWADADGVIPLGAGTGEPPLAERVRARLRAEEGDLGVQRVEALLQELTGQSLEEWLRRRFFEHHVRQFKYRPIAWHLASTPVRAEGGKRKGEGRRAPAFECLLYYHACGGDVLARLRTQYVERLAGAERARIAEARRAGDDNAAVLPTARLQELEDFAARLRAVEDAGFACPALDDLLAAEPLDRWSGDGYFAPPDAEALRAAERAWRVDLNDGVRVNIAPVQLAGLLAADVLKAADAQKALADRARWRADERRWVRAGQLPRPGWLPATVPDSPAWLAAAPARAAEQHKLAAKRQVALAGME